MTSAKQFAPLLPHRCPQILINMVGTAGFEPDRRVSQGIRFLDFSGISTILPLAPIPGCARVREVVTKSVTGDSK